MPCTEAYKEHIMYTFNGYCKTVIRFAAITAYSKRIRLAALENGHINQDTEDSIKRRLISALFQFRFDRQAT